jgi:hypothetical protein
MQLIAQRMQQIAQNLPLVKLASSIGKRGKALKLTASSAAKHK